MGAALDALAGGIGTTLQITAGAFAIGALLGLFVALARRSAHRAVATVGTIYVELFRSIPIIAWLFIIYYGLAQEAIRLSSLTAAIVGLGLVSAAYLGEIFRASLASVARGQWEAASALGLGRGASLLRVIFPQAVRLALPASATYAIGLLKDSAIASIIGASDITLRAFNETQATGDGLLVFGVAAALYLALSVPLAVVARWLDHRLRRTVAT